MEMEILQSTKDSQNKRTLPLDFFWLVLIKVKWTYFEQENILCSTWRC